ncbi:MAG: hypothetical protein EZS28_032826 [Streblomastix strix]|uniref:Uncharacterized protein n=1 Tax=Streblomastix strix TaxID=222440 RepID=A0A5J4UMN4_9EUKA|nr:MAG: hypothetical protein EZS28_032826 [Streblomastix strix]
MNQPHRFTSLPGQVNRTPKGSAFKKPNFVSTIQAHDIKTQQNHNNCKQQSNNTQFQRPNISPKATSPPLQQIVKRFIPKTSAFNAQKLSKPNSLIPIKSDVLASRMIFQRWEWEELAGGDVSQSSAFQNNYLQNDNNQLQPRRVIKRGQLSGRLDSVVSALQTEHDRFQKWVSKVDNLMESDALSILEKDKMQGSTHTTHKNRTNIQIENQIEEDEYNEGVIELASPVISDITDMQTGSNFLTSLPRAPSIHMSSFDSIHIPIFIARSLHSLLSLDERIKKVILQRTQYQNAPNE